MRLDLNMGLWKDNWEETKQHHLDWWQQRGIMLGMWGAPPPGGRPHADVPDPGPAASPEQYHSDPIWRAKHERYRLSRQGFAADSIPITPGSPGVPSMR